jgi:hypothetical protein
MEWVFSKMEKQLEIQIEYRPNECDIESSKGDILEVC